MNKKCGHQCTNKTQKGQQKINSYYLLRTVFLTLFHCGDVSSMLNVGVHVNTKNNNMFKEDKSMER